MPKYALVETGLEVDVSGKLGTVAGDNVHANIQVKFYDEWHICNCHLTWKTTYYRDGQVIAEYKTSDSKEIQ
jgi:hypothetical protein